MKIGVTSPAFIVTALLLLAGTLFLAEEANSPLHGIVFMPFAFGPLIVSLVMAAMSRIKSCQWMLVISSLLYAGWFWFMYLYAVIWNPGAQSGLFILVVGLYSLPVMVPVWAITLVWRRNGRNNRQLASSSDGV